MVATFIDPYHQRRTRVMDNSDVMTGLIVNTVMLTGIIVMKIVVYVHVTSLLKDCRELLKFTKLHGKVTESQQDKANRSIGTIAQVAVDVKHTTDTIKSVVKEVTDHIASESGTKLKRPDVL